MFDGTQLRIFYLFDNTLQTIIGKSKIKNEFHYYKLL